MNNNLEFENTDPSPDSVEDNYPRTNYGEGYYEEPKQETLEEAAKKFTENLYYKVGDADEFNGEPLAVYDAFIADAKWQQEQDKNKYSDEDMIEFGKYLLQLSNSAMSRKFNMKMLDSETGIKLTKDLLKQFKNK